MLKNDALVSWQVLSCDRELVVFSGSYSNFMHRVIGGYFYLTVSLGVLQVPVSEEYVQCTCKDEILLYAQSHTCALLTLVLSSFPRDIPLLYSQP